MFCVSKADLMEMIFGCGISVPEQAARVSVNLTWSI